MDRLVVRMARPAGRRAKWLAAGEIEVVPGVEEVMRERGVVVDGDTAEPGYFKAIRLDDDRGVFVQADAEEFGMPVDDREEILLAVALREMLVNRDAAEIAEAFFVAGRHHEGVAFARAANQV